MSHGSEVASSGAAPQSLDWTGTARYTVVRRIERGGMGSVYEAYDHERQQHVALKTLLYFSPTSLFKFKQEFRALVDMRHPNLVRLYELVAIEGERVFFSMELVRGTDFVSYVRGPAGLGSPASFDRLRRVLRQLVEGVEALHAAGKVHRDLKPANVLVTPEGRVVILDLGVATELPRVADENLRERGELVGTACYVAPEQWSRDELTLASDWYSVGVILYEALVGRPPVEGSVSEVIRRKTSDKPAPPSGSTAGIPHDLDALSLALLAREPTARPTGPEILRRLSVVHTPSSPLPALDGPPGGQAIVHGDAALVGREAQSAALRDAFEAVRIGRSVTVHVDGPTGMGKSTLVQHFLDGLSRRGDAVVLRGRAYERESVPYKAVDAAIDDLSRYLVHLSDDDEGSLSLPEHMDDLVRLFPVLGRVPSTDRHTGEYADPQRVRRRGFGALRELVANLGARQPLILSIDDVQWGDRDSVALLLELVRPPHAPPLLLLLIHRDEDAQTAPFLTELRKRWPGGAESRRVSVGPLEREDAGRLALRLLGSEDGAARELADAMSREAGGSPFLIEELTRSSTGRLLVAADATVTLEQVVRERVAQLPENVREAMEMVAVAGRPLPVSTLCEATGIGSIDGAVALLVAHRLVRSGLRDGREVLEPLHDRIRETIAALLTPSTVRRHHARMARALEAAPEADPEALAMHLIGAGEGDRATQHAERAAERAASKLAFDQAARLMRVALETSSPSSPDRRRLQTRLGEMLGQAGLGAEAARVYLEAAEGASTLDRAELERAAAEQLLSSGRIDEGAVVLRRVLATAGMRTPRSPLGAIVSLVFYRAQMLIVGLRFKERRADDVSRTDRLRLEALASAGLGFAVIDVVLGACILARYFVMALRVGDRPHVLRAALMMLTQHANTGGPEGKRERALRALAKRLTEQSESDELTGFFHGTRGVALFLRGSWKEALEVLDNAYTEYPSTRAGWHSNANLFGVYALMYLGQVRELAERRARLLQDAEQRGDLYSVVNLRLSPPKLLSLADDDPGAVFRDVSDAMRLWSQRGYLVQHWQAMRAEADAELYGGSVERAYDRVRRDARALKKSFLLEGQFTRALTAELRGRCAIASIAAAPSERSGRLAEARRMARQLDREKVPYASLFACILKAGVASLTGDFDQAAEWLRGAVRLADENHMVLHAQVARYRLGGLLGGEAGRSLVREALEGMEAQPIRAPARFVAMLVPGRWPPAASEPPESPRDIR